MLLFVTTRSLPLFLMALLAGCEDAPPFTVELYLKNPSAMTFTGAGGALGSGLEIRREGLEDGQELIVETECRGRRCGEPAEVDPGLCGVEPREIGPGSQVKVGWDGRYMPRSWDVFGECLGAARAVPAGPLSVTICGRLRGEGTRMAPLRCRECTLEVQDGTTLARGTTVPGLDETGPCFQEVPSVEP